MEECGKKCNRGARYRKRERGGGVRQRGIERGGERQSIERRDLKCRERNERQGRGGSVCVYVGERERERGTKKWGRDSETKDN